MSYACLLEPAVEPISIAQMRHYLKLDGAEEDAFLETLIKGARQRVERASGRALIRQVWRWTLDDWPMGLPAPRALAPVAGVVAMRARLGAGWTTLGANVDYALEGGPDDARIAMIVSPPPLAVARGGIEIDLALGYGDAPEAVPEPLRQAARVLVADGFENRGDCEAGGRADLDRRIQALIAPYRRMRLQ